LVLPLLALLFAGLAAAETSSRVVLSPPLAQWKRDIEAAGKTTVVLARVFTDTARNELTLPDDVEFRPFLRKMLNDEAFVKQFVQTHAINVNSNTGLRPISVVLLNMARSADWEGQEDAVIAHELGHIWLHTRGYEAPQGLDGLSCVAVHAGDIVQHVLIREQMRARHIDYLPFWISSLEAALLQMDGRTVSNPQIADQCQHISRLALWVDVAVGLSDREWPRRQALLAGFRNRFPELKDRSDRIAAILRGRNLNQKVMYQKTLRSVLLNIH